MSASPRRPQAFVIDEELETKTTIDFAPEATLADVHNFGKRVNIPMLSLIARRD